jgi:ribosomal protein S18 acetylase RimI-like enzyme
MERISYSTKCPSLKPPISNEIWRWVKFLAWLPWFFLTFPWQLRKGYREVMAAVSIGGDWDIYGLGFHPELQSQRIKFEDTQRSGFGDPRLN